MAYKQFFLGRGKGTNAALPNNNAENITLYTAPANGAVIKEIIRKGFGPGATAAFAQLYILKNGGTDIGTGVSTDVTDGSTANTWDAVAVTGAREGNPLTTVPAFTRLTLALVLGSGDVLKLRLMNESGGALNMTTLGLYLSIAGYEL